MPFLIIAMGGSENKKPSAIQGKVDACGLVALASHICFFAKPPCPEWQVGAGVGPSLNVQQSYHDPVNW